MSEGPPFRDDYGSVDSDEAWPDWKEQTEPLDYQDRDIRLLFPGEFYTDRRRRLGQEVADFGDFDPKPSDPDPDVWPVQELDPGYPADVDDLVLLTNTFPAPNVAWVTKEYIKRRYGYDAFEPRIGPRELPPHERPENESEAEIFKLKSEYTPSMKLTEDRLEALDRLARLWNGDVVRGNHLLIDKCPSWMDLFGDLEQEELRRLRKDPTIDQELKDKFGHHDWYQRRASVFMKPQHMLRKKVYYAPTQKGRTLINKNDDLPNLMGDPNEGLTHRLTVGLTAVIYTVENHEVGTYHEYEDYVIDVMSRGPDGNLFAFEIMTGHNNWELHRQTYKKMEWLRERDIIPVAVFDSRKTAYEVLNHWQNKGLCEIPGGTFNSEFRIEKGREKVQKAFESPDYRCAVIDWFTTSKYWQFSFGSDDRNIDDQQVQSLDW